jgi:hypothetical protein
MTKVVSCHRNAAPSKCCRFIQLLSMRNSLRISCGLLALLLLPWVATANTDSYSQPDSTTPPPAPLQSVRPVLECVTQTDDTTFTAHFGYLNPNSVSVTVAVGSGNRFNPNPIDRGQTTVFLPGRQVRVFTVPFKRGNQVWFLQGRTSTASTGSKRCAASARLSAEEPTGKVSVFPNPADPDGFNVQNIKADVAVPTLYTVQGTNVPIRHRALCDTQLEVRPAAKLPSGTYILKVTEGPKSRSVKVLIQ